jgi:hypothetical protein
MRAIVLISLQPPPFFVSRFLEREKTHSAEQQMALLGFVGVPVKDRPRTRLAVTDAAFASLEAKLDFFDSLFDIHQSSFALLHPTAALCHQDVGH